MSTSTRDLPTIATTDGSRVYASTGEVFPIKVPAGMPWSASGLAEACARRGIAQLWMVPAPWLDFTGDTLGWDFREEDTDETNKPASWIPTFKRGTNLTVALARPGFDTGSPWKGAQDARTLLAGLLRYRELLGVTFHHSASATSRELLIGSHQGHRNNVRLQPVPMPPPALDVSTEAPMSWVMAPEAVRALPEYRYIHAYDKNASFLGASCNLTLGAGKPTHLTSWGLASDLKLPGYFRIMPPECEDGVPSFVATRRDAGDGTRWVTTPTLSFLTERDDGRVPTIREAYIWREHHQPLEPWYTVLRDARAALIGEDSPASRLALAAVKASYTSLLGGYLASTSWDRTGDELYRPDIRHMVIAKARCTVVRTARRCQQAGAVVLGISGVDTFYVLSNDPDPVAGKPEPLTLGTEQRAYKVKGSIPFSPALRATLEQGALPATRLLGQLDAEMEGETAEETEGGAE